jgi:PHD/YefM family antitoxin component YafN of YafNO toxin-antitoxin module
MPTLKEIEKQAADLMGFTQESIGKTQARKEFFPLVDGLGKTSSAVEITDHDKPVAVLLSYQNYVSLVAKLCMLSKVQALKSPPNLIGSIKIKTDDLEAASADIAAKFKKSLQESADNL